MIKIKPFVSLSILSFALSSSSLLAMDSEFKLFDTKDKKGLTLRSERSSRVQIQPPLEIREIDKNLLAYTYEGKKIVRGEVPGDGSCAFHTLNVLFPTKYISRKTFINRINHIVQQDTPEAQDIKDGLASELLSGLYLEALTGTPCEYKGTFIDSIKPKLTLTLIGESDQAHQNNINTIKSKSNVIKDIIDCLAQEHMMLTLPMDGTGGGSLILVCKVFKLNVDALWIPKENGSEQEQRQAALFKKLNFGGNTAFKSFIRTGQHFSPVCAENDRNMRHQFALN